MMRRKVSSPISGRSARYRRASPIAATVIIIYSSVRVDVVVVVVTMYATPV